MRRLIYGSLSLLILLSGTFPAQAAVETPFHLCYFSLNNHKEFKEMEKFLEKLNKVSPRKITVTEYVNQENNPDAKESFMAMINSGAPCDGLVISGHHTGSFGGERASGSLDIGFLESLSCDPRYESWFRNIQSLWLQGCRTLGVGKIESYQEAAEANSADFHTNRVGNVLAEDGLTQSFADLNMEFSATLDQDNPLSSRYLRVFPRSSVFGWTQTAPGRNSRSEYSIPYHVAHIAKLNDDRKVLFEDPCESSTLSDKTAVCYANALTSLLNSPDKLTSTQKSCKRYGVQGWIDHGKPKKGEYGFDNQDLNAYEPLEKILDPDLTQAHEDDCKLKSAKKPDDILKALGSVLRNQKSLGYSFNSVWELMQRLKESQSEEDLAILEQVQKKLKSDAELQAFLSKKLSSPQLGLLRKVDYYSFYRDLTGQKVEAVEKLIIAAAKKQLFMDSSASYDLRDYQDTLVQSLAKNGMLYSDLVQELASELKDPNMIFKQVANAIRNTSISQRDSSKILEAIVQSSKVNEETLRHVAAAVGYSKFRIREGSKILETIMQSPRADAKVLSSIATAIGQSKTEILGASKMLETVIQSPKADASTLGRVAGAIGKSKFEIQGASKMLNTLIQSEKADAFTLSSVAEAIGKSKFEIQGASKILEALMQSPKTDASTLGGVARAIGKSKFEIQGASKMLETVVHSEIADRFTLGRVAGAIGSSKFDIQDSSKMLEAVIQSKKADKYTLAEVVTAIGSSNFKIQDAPKLLEAIVQSPRVGNSTFEALAITITSSTDKLRLEEKLKIAKEIMRSPEVNQDTLDILQAHFKISE